MRSKAVRFSVISAIVLTVMVIAALMVMSVTGSETKAQAGQKIGLSLTGDEESSVVAYNQHNLIRFHVIANSDSERDQALKRKVRDLIVEKMTPEFSRARSLQDARSIAREHLGDMKRIAEKEIGSWGEKYPVRVQLGRFDFPVKTYGSLTLPAGNYEAVRVVIGEGQGANWWCVLFPPLCFVDVSRAMTTSDYKPALAVDAKFTDNRTLTSYDALERRSDSGQNNVDQNNIDQNNVDQNNVYQSRLDDSTVVENNNTRLKGSAEKPNVLAADTGLQYQQEAPQIKIRFKILDLFNWVFN